MSTQLERLKQVASTSVENGENVDISTVSQHQPVAIPFSQKLKESLLARLTFSTDEDRREAEQLILHLCSKLVDNPRVYATFQGNLGNAVKIVTQILAMKLPIGDTNMYYLVPYKDTLQLQISYQGLLEIAYRSGIKMVMAQPIYANDDFEMAYGNPNTYRHVPCRKERGQLEGYYAVAKLNGDIQIEYMSIDDLNAHKAKFSKGGNIWTEHFDAMCRKTVIKKVLKLCPKSPQLAAALKTDDETEYVE